MLQIGIEYNFIFFSFLKKLKWLFSENYQTWYLLDFFIWFYVDIYRIPTSLSKSFSKGVRITLLAY